MNLKSMLPVAVLLLAAVALASASDSPASPRRFKIPRASVPGFPEPRSDPADIAIGERLFLETRFSQFFAGHSRSNANAALTYGDPSVAATVTTGKPWPGPFAGHAISCRACHLVAEHREAGHGNRSYADFARRSPLPARPDGRRVTTRNSPAMVNAVIPREGEMLLHFDGEFTSIESLIKDTLTGRNFGWLPEEGDKAIRHLARVIRDDDGQGPLAREFGGHSYRQVLLGEDRSLGEEGEGFRLPEEYRLDVSTAGDGQILAAVTKLVGAYADSLFFSRDESNEYDGSPYDAFIETNQIPRKPDPGQSELYYNRHVLDLAVSLKTPLFIDGTNYLDPPAPGKFKTLAQPFRFGAQEWEGMKIFFALTRFAPAEARVGGRRIGNCAACHPGPNFTDFRFHNTGVAQEEYDGLHGPGAFAGLKIPDLATRNAAFDEFLPATAKHPRARGPFLDVPSASRRGRTDLGLWNVFGNPDRTESQAALRTALLGEEKPVSDTQLLPRTIALFKTPGLRGLAFSDPYLHNGSEDTLEDVIRFYIRTAALARAGKLRNADPELSGILLSEDDIAPLSAFLRSLNEDYE